LVARKWEGKKSKKWLFDDVSSCGILLIAAEQQEGLVPFQYIARVF
jgi:hypothetical protein